MAWCFGWKRFSNLFPTLFSHFVGVHLLQNLERLRTKKIRGLRRRQKNIDIWFNSHQKIDLDILKKSQYYYCKSKIDPWSNLYYDVDYPSNYRKQLFSKLLTIYELWKKQLNLNFDNFYLAIWINDKRFIDSQVVSAIGERSNYYKKMWNLHEQPLEFPNELFSNETERIKLFNWISTDDEDLIPESNFLNAEKTDYYSPHDYHEDMRFYRKLIKKKIPSRMIGDEKGNNPEKVFILKQGNIWIGKHK